MRITREVALTEVWLDAQARLAGPSLSRVSGREWAAEIAKAAVWLVGLVLAILLLALLAPASRADSIDASTVSAYLTANTPLPLAVGIGGELAQNLLTAQYEAWGQVWQEGSLQASEDAVLRAIGLYVWPGGPSSITDACCAVVFEQSKVAIDLRLTVGTTTGGLDFGNQPVATPEPVGLLVVGLLVLLVYSGLRSKFLLEQEHAKTTLGEAPFCYAAPAPILPNNPSYTRASCARRSGRLYMAVALELVRARIQWRDICSPTQPTQKSQSSLHAPRDYVLSCR